MSTVLFYVPIDHCCSLGLRHVCFLSLSCPVPRHVISLSFCLVLVFNSFFLYRIL
jgi:hypothetical protein